jgi:outer membrane protein OmpA-like peptidoglycan-associated protein
MPYSLKSPLVWCLSITSIALFGCATIPEPSPILAEAQAAYTAAAADPNTVRYAPNELKRAGDALTRAQQLQKETTDREATSHYAYLAKRYTEVAQQVTQTKMAQQVVESASVERNKAIMSARARESELAKQRADEQVRKAQMQARDLEKQLSELNAKRTNRGLVLTLSDVLFDVGQATLKPGAHHTIDHLVAVMKENPNIGVRVEGFTDNTGGEQFNLELSQKRAVAIRTALVDRGIDANRIDARGYGESLPVASNNTAAGRQANRRVEIVVSNNAKLGPGASLRQ